MTYKAKMTKRFWDILFTELEPNAGNLLKVVLGKTVERLTERDENEDLSPYFTVSLTIPSFKEVFEIEDDEKAYELLVDVLNYLGGCLLRKFDWKDGNCNQTHMSSAVWSWNQAEDGAFLVRFSAPFLLSVISPDFHCTYDFYAPNKKKRIMYSYLHIPSSEEEEE